jgi:hypothetical protein
MTAIHAPPLLLRRPKAVVALTRASCTARARAVRGRLVTTGQSVGPGNDSFARFNFGSILAPNVGSAGFPSDAATEL